MSRELRDRLEAAQVKKVELELETVRVLKEAAQLEKELEPFVVELDALKAEVAELELATMSKSELPGPPTRMPVQLGPLGFAALIGLLTASCLIFRWFVD